MQVGFEDMEEREIVGGRLGVTDWEDDDALATAMEEWLGEPPEHPDDNDIRRAREAELRQAQRGAHRRRHERAQAAPQFGVPSRPVAAGGRVYYGESRRGQAWADLLRRPPDGALRWLAATTRGRSLPSPERRSARSPALRRAAS